MTDPSEAVAVDDVEIGTDRGADESSSVIVQFESVLPSSTEGLELRRQGRTDRSAATRTEVTPEEIEMVMRALQRGGTPIPPAGEVTSTVVSDGGPAQMPASSPVAVAPIPPRDGYRDFAVDHHLSAFPADERGGGDENGGISHAQTSTAASGALGGLANGAPANGVILDALPVSFDDFVAHGGAPVVGIPIECHPATSPQPASPTGTRRTSQPGTAASTATAAATTTVIIPVPPNMRFTEELAEAWRSCRALRMYCISHVFIIALMLIKFVWALAFCILPVIGFFGARLYRPGLLKFYLFSFAATIGLRGYVTYALATGSGASSTTMIVVFIVLGVVGAILELHIARHVRRVAGLLKDLSHEQRLLLRGGTVELQVAN